MEAGRGAPQGHLRGEFAHEPDTGLSTHAATATATATHLPHLHPSSPLVLASHLEPRSPACARGGQAECRGEDVPPVVAAHAPFVQKEAERGREGEVPSYDDYRVIKSHLPHFR